MITDESIQKQCDALAKILKEKNANYGNAFAEAPYLLPEMGTTTAAFVRLSDKFRRLRTIYNNKEEKDRRKLEETLEDTIRDVAGYCILLLAFVDKIPKSND